MNMRNLFTLLLVTIASTANAEPSASVGPVQVVAQLYRDYAWEAVIDKPRWVGQELQNQPGPVLQRYFDSNLAALIVFDRMCAIQTQEICRLDFSLIWASQDPGASEAKIVAGPKPDTVLVSFRYPGDGKKIDLSYRMVKTRELKGPGSFNQPLTLKPPRTQQPKTPVTHKAAGCLLQCRPTSADFFLYIFLYV